MFFCFSLLWSNQIFGQTKDELLKEKYLLYSEIDIAQKLLRNTKDDKKSSITELVLLQKKINNRHEIVANIEQHVQLLAGNMNTIEFQIEELESKLRFIKAEYADMLRESYLSQNDYSQLMFLFSAMDFNDAYRRFKYMQYYRKHRKSQLQDILTMKDTLQGKLQTLAAEKVEQDELLLSEKNEKRLLENERQEQKQLIGSLKKTEKQIRQKLAQKEKALSELNEQIRDIIAKATKNDDVPPPPKAVKNEISRKPTHKPIEDAKLTGLFAKKKGKLDWPVHEGVVTSKFGKNRHPVLKNITTTNNGIDITTAKNTAIKAIFEGTVSNILFNPTFQWAVIVKHGNYFTVYANLEEVRVAKGNKIEVGQKIGTVFTNWESGKTAVHLEIWEKNKKLNPIYWLRKKAS
ncbi:MAG: murein hydrolase activator EnvC family protein [Chitinophagales bacterium]